MKNAATKTIKTLKAEFIAYRNWMNNEPEIHVFDDLFLVESFINRQPEQYRNDAQLAAKFALADIKERIAA